VPSRLSAAAAEGLVGAFCSLVRSPDAEAARLALQVLELFLRAMPGGPQAVEAAVCNPCTQYLPPPHNPL